MSTSPAPITSPVPGGRPPLSERRQHLAQLEQLLLASRAGTGSSAVVTGPVGCGKTALLQTFAERATATGSTVLSATCSATERQLPFGAILQLLRKADPVAQVQAVRPRLCPPGAGTGSDGQLLAGDTAELVTAACGALLALAARTPTVLLVDDLQHVDQESLHCLLYLSRRIRGVPVALVYAEQDRPVGADQPLHDDLMRQADCRRVAVGPLSFSGVAEALSAAVPAVPAGPLAPGWAAVTGGNPLLLRGLLDDLQALPSAPTCVADLDTQPPFGASFRAAVVSCLLRADPPVLPLVAGLAVLGAAATPEAVARLARTAPASVQEQLARLSSAGLLEGLRFRCAAVRSAVLGALNAQESADLHYDVAALLHHDGAPSTVVADHLLAAGARQEPWVRAVLEDASETSLAVDQVAEAARYLELAHAGSTDRADRRRIELLLARLAWHTDPARILRHLPRLTAAAERGELSTPEVVSVLNYQLWHGRHEAAAPALRALCAADPDAPEASRTASRMLRLGMVTSFPGLLAAAGVDAAQRHADLEPVPVTADPRLRSGVALATAMQRGAQPSAIAAAEQVLQACRLGAGTVEALASAVLTLVYAERPELAAAACDQLLTEVRSRRAPVWQAGLTGIRALIAVRQGEPEHASGLAQDALELMAPAGWGVTIGVPLAAAVLGATAAGRYEEAGRFLATPLPEGLFASRAGLHLLHARGRYHLATGRRRAALADFLHCGELLRAWDLDRPAVVAWRSCSAEVLVATGDVQRASSLVREELDLLGPAASAARGNALRVLALAEPSRRTFVLGEAVAVLEASQDRYALALALADLGRACRSAGERSRSRLLIRRAWQLAGECGATALCEQLAPAAAPADAVAQVAGGPEGPDAAATSAALAPLTDAERRVATQAAQGFTNREIAQRLYLTVSTVEQHLTRVYRKLAVRQRDELPSSLYVDSATAS